MTQPTNVQRLPGACLGDEKDGTFIYAYGQDGHLVRVGVMLKDFNALLDDRDAVASRAREYYDRLVEEGIIKPEPTPEQIIQRQAAVLDQYEAALPMINSLVQAMPQINAMLKDWYGDKGPIAPTAPVAEMVG